MKRIKLTPRLSMIASLVPHNSRVIDIGTDHGYIPIFLATQGDGSFATQGNGSFVSLKQLEKRDTKEPFPCAVIASDINEKPLIITKKNIIKHNCENKIELRLGSGLKVLKRNDVDVIIIAGMGGILISEMIDESRDILRKNNILILQPMQAQKELRKYLTNTGFEITKDLLVEEDNRIYEIIVAKKGEQTVEKDIYYEIGFHLKSNSNSLVTKFLKKKMQSFEKIISNLVNNSLSDTVDKEKEYNKKIMQIEKLISEFER
ncbi:MAG: tRNA (adenine(22)-N(1))-methyltransferase [Alkaliphilus sp.]